jgi:hypothetical protein
MLDHVLVEPQRHLLLRCFRWRASALAPHALRHKLGTYLVERAHPSKLLVCERQRVWVGFGGGRNARVFFVRRLLDRSASHLAGDLEPTLDLSHLIVGEWWI